MSAYFSLNSSFISVLTLRHHPLHSCDLLKVTVGIPNYRFLGLGCCPVDNYERVVLVLNEQEPHV